MYGCLLPFTCDVPQPKYLEENWPSQRTKKILSVTAKSHPNMKLILFHDIQQPSYMPEGVATIRMTSLLISKLQQNEKQLAV
jgi:hypothetical protein